MQGRSDPDVERLQQQLRRVLRGLRRRHTLPPEIAAQFGKAKLSPRHLGALAVIGREQPLSVGELAAHLDVTLASASLIATELADAALVRRAEDDADRRRTLLFVADRFGASVQDWLGARQAPFRRALDRLEPGERDALLRGLAAIADELPEHGCRRHRRGAS